jgi:hypothetical protein
MAEAHEQPPVSPWLSVGWMGTVRSRAEVARMQEAAGSPPRVRAVRSELRSRFSAIAAPGALASGR